MTSRAWLGLTLALLACGLGGALMGGSVAWLTGRAALGLHALTPR